MDNLLRAKFEAFKNLPPKLKDKYKIIIKDGRLFLITEVKALIKERNEFEKNDRVL